MYYIDLLFLKLNFNLDPCSTQNEINIRALFVQSFISYLAFTFRVSIKFYPFKNKLLR